MVSSVPDGGGAGCEHLVLMCSQKWPASSEQQGPRKGCRLCIIGPAHGLWIEMLMVWGGEGGACSIVRAGGLRARVSYSGSEIRNYLPTPSLSKHQHSQRPTTSSREDRESPTTSSREDRESGKQSRALAPRSCMLSLLDSCAAEALNAFMDSCDAGALDALMTQESLPTKCGGTR